MVVRILLVWMFFISLAAQSQLISATQKKVSKFSFDTNTYVFFNASILNSYRSLIPNESHLNTPLGIRANENPLICSSYTIGVSMPVNKSLKINTGLSFSQNGESYSWISGENDSSFLYSSIYRYIALPISLSTSYGKKIKLRLSAGIVPSIFSGYKQMQEWTDINGSEYNEETTIPEDDINFFKISTQGSIGIEYFFKKLSVHVAYLYIQQLNNSYKEFEDYIHRENTQGAQITLTYFLK
tara:strand:+ start:3030 stop:3752 length:723 start_codon:yes stop_codon:yes gene_type:complete